MVLAILGLFVAVTAAPADVTGKWEGKLSAQREDGTTNEEPALLILEQKGSTVTGTAGRDESDRHPITKGTIDGSKISLVVKNTRNDRELQVELTVENDEMKGTLTAGERRAQLVLKKRKD